VNNNTELEQGPQLSHASRIGNFIVRNKAAIAATGVLGMGAVSGLMNVRHGLDEVTNAAINQIIHSGISAATLMKIHELLAKRVKTLAAEVVPVVIPAALTTAICYTIHKFGIPYLREPSAEPALSTLPTAVVIALIMPVYHVAHHSKRISDKIHHLFKN